MMTSKTKIAHVGGGYWGKNIIRNLAEMSVLSHICDANPDVLQNYRKQYPDVAATERFDAVLADTSVEAVSIATPGATHYALVKDALTAGKDVFVEKPLALHPDEGRELADLAAKHQRILMVGHILRYHPAVKKIKSLIDGGALGNVRYCYSNRLNLGKVRSEENILWSFAPHDISMLNFLMNGPPDEVRASGEIILQPGIHDVTLTVLKWHNGAMAHIYVSWLHPFKEHRFVVVGDRAMLVFDDTQQAEKLVLYDRGFDIIRGEAVKREEDGKSVDFAHEEPLRKELEHFVHCVQTREQPITDAQEAIAVLGVLHRAQATLETPTSSNANSDEAYYVHPTAVVDAGAEIGKGTKIWHFSHVMSGAKLGERCSLGQNVFVANNVVIGDNVKIQNNVSVYEGVVLEDDTFCGPSMVFTNVKNPRSSIPRNTADDYLKTVVRRGATLGANCTIVCGNTIGRNAFVAAGAVVKDDVPPNALMTGVPAKQKGWMCDCGFRLIEHGKVLTCRECGSKYKVNSERLLEKVKVDG